MQLPVAYGPYLLVELLGSGSMGEVFLARPLDPTLGVPELVVVKRLHPELLEDSFLRRFWHEAALAIRVDDPHLVRVYDAGQVGSTAYFAMDFVAGRTLTTLIRAGRPLSTRAVLHVLSGILTGLRALHDARDDAGASLGIVHRDLATKNVMIDEEGRARLIDLGIGRSRLSDWRTATGAVMGTPGFMSPEQAQGLPVGQQTDVWSVGAMAFELLTLKPLIPRGNPLEMLGATVLAPVRPVETLRADLPPALAQIVSRALAKDPAERFASAIEMLDALKPLVGAAKPTELAELGPAPGARAKALFLARQAAEAYEPSEPTELRTMVRRPGLSAGVEASEANLPVPMIEPTFLGSVATEPAYPLHAAASPLPAVGAPRPSLPVILAALGAVLAGFGLTMAFHFVRDAERQESQGRAGPGSPGALTTTLEPVLERTGTDLTMEGDAGKRTLRDRQGGVLVVGPDATLRGFKTATADGWIVTSTAKAGAKVGWIGTVRGSAWRVRPLSINDCDATARIGQGGIEIVYPDRSIVLPEGGGLLKTLSFEKPAFATRLELKTFGLAFGKDEPSRAGQPCGRGFGKDHVVVARVPPGDYSFLWFGQDAKEQPVTNNVSVTVPLEGPDTIDVAAPKSK